MAADTRPGAGEEPAPGALDAQLPRPVRYVRLPLDVSGVAGAEDLVQWGSVGDDGALLLPPSDACGGFGRCCRIVAVSDTHDLHGQLPHPLPKGDLLVHCGDFSNGGADGEFSRFDGWLQRAAAGGFGERIFCVAGNHDGPLKRHGVARAAFLPHCQLLEAQPAKKKLCPPGLRLYGLSWSGTCRALPAEPPVDVLLTHGPPSGILDANLRGHSHGDLALRRLLDGSVPPRLHLFGHIHEAYGAELCEFAGTSKLGQRTLLLNVSNAGPPDPDFSPPAYLPNPVTVIDLELPQDGALGG